MNNTAIKWFKENIIYFISLTIILWSSYICIDGIMFIIRHNFNNDLTSYSNLLQNLSKVFRVHSALLMIPIFLMIFALIKKEIKIEYFAISILLSFVFNSYQFFDNIIHPYLFNLHIYDFLLREGQTVLNPQYSKLFIFCLLLLALLIICFKKKYRSIDRIFISLISSSVLVTLLLFHIALPMGMFKFINYQLQQDISYQANTLSESILCSNRSCFLLDSNLNLLKENKTANEELLKKYSYFIYQANNYYKNKDNNNNFSGALGSFKGQEFDYIISVVKKMDNGYMVVMDENIGKKYSRQSEIWFSFLTSCAHFVWIYGGLWLLFHHKNKFIKKRKILE